MTIRSINPTDESLNSEFELFSDSKVIQICKEVRRAFGPWQKLSVAARCGHLLKLAEVLRTKKHDYAKLITLEMGKPLAQSMAEVEKCAATADYYAELAPEWLADELIETSAQRSLVAYQPMGVILAIMPWNFPFWQLIRCAVPALAVGNGVILRHANTVPMCAMALENAFVLAGFPENIFRTIICDHPIIKRLMRLNLVDGASLTGSVGAGRKVGEIAGKYLKKVVLELGGADPFIVLKDADIEAASNAAVEGRNVNSGQSCIAAKRFIVVAEVAEAFTAKFIEKMKKLKVGDPFDVSVDTGPMATQKQREILADQVQRSVAMGAKVEVGGRALFDKGYFYAPTVMTQVNVKMPVFKEEVFGPVAPVLVVKNEREALRVANKSRLGLGASVWTQDLARGEAFARQLEAGMVFVNSIVKSDPKLPFGGVKDSGVGRELSHHGLMEFVNVKTLSIA